MFVRAIWNKLLDCIFESFEIARVKQGQFEDFQKSQGWFSPKITRTKHVITINHRKTINTNTINNNKKQL